MLPRDETSADVELISDLEKLHTGHGVQIPDGSDALVLGLAMMKVMMMKMMVCWFFCLAAQDGGDHDSLVAGEEEPGQMAGGNEVAGVKQGGTWAGGKPGTWRRCR